MLCQLVAMYRQSCSCIRQVAKVSNEKYKSIYWLERRIARLSDAGPAFMISNDCRGYKLLRGMSRPFTSAKAMRWLYSPWTEWLT